MRKKGIAVRRFLADTQAPGPMTISAICGGEHVTVIGAQLTVVAVPLQIYAITQSSAYVGLTGLSRAGAAHRVRPVGGALADVFDRRTILGDNVGSHRDRRVVLPAGRRRVEQRGCCWRCFPCSRRFRGEPADPQVRCCRASFPRPSCRPRTVEHDGDAGRRDRRTAARRCPGHRRRVLGDVSTRQSVCC